MNSELVELKMKNSFLRRTVTPHWQADPNADKDQNGPLNRRG